MDTFSTPGSTPSLGADRDARMTIKRPVPPDLDQVQKTLLENRPELLGRGDRLEIETFGRKQGGALPGWIPTTRSTFARPMANAWNCRVSIGRASIVSRWIASTGNGSP